MSQLLRMSFTALALLIGTPLFAGSECTCDAKCAAECASYGAACSACVLRSCPNELNACQSLACAN